MKATILAGCLLAATATTLGAQTKTIQGEMVTVTATIESIERSTREVTLKEQNGEYSTIKAGPEFKRFDQLKVGDKVTARYYDNIVLRLKLPGEKDVDTGSEALTRGTNTAPGATVSSQRVITATITQLDPKVPSITFTGPNNWKYSSRVQDTAMLKKVKVGDKVDITWTEAVLLSIE